MSLPGNYNCPRSQATLLIRSGESPNILRVGYTVLALPGPPVSQIVLVFDSPEMIFAEDSAYAVSEPRTSAHWEGSYEYSFELARPITAGEQRVVSYTTVLPLPKVNEFRIGCVGRTTLKVTFESLPRTVWQMTWKDDGSNDLAHPKQEVFPRAIEHENDSTAWWVGLEAIGSDTTPGYVWE